MQPTFKRAKDWLRFYWVIFDSGVRREYYVDVHNILAQPVGSIIRYNYLRTHCTDECWAEIEKRTLGHDVLLAYTQYRGFSRGDDETKFEQNTPKWHCPTRIARMAGIIVNGDQVYFDLMLGDYPNPTRPAFKALIGRLEAKDAVPFNKFADIQAERDVFDSTASPDPSGSKENWSVIVNELDRNSQFKGDSFWRIAGPFRRNSNKPIPYSRLALRSDAIYQLDFRDSEAAYFQVQNQESASKVATPNVTGRSLKISVSEPSLQIRDTILPFRHYFETALFFRAKKQESIRPSESVIEFTTQGEASSFPLGASFKLHYTVRLDRRKVVVGGISAFGGALLATIALKEKLTGRDVTMFMAALVLLAIASLLLQDKIKIGSSGGD